MIAKLLALITGNTLSVAAVSGLVVVVLAWDHSRINQARREGAATVRALIEKNTDANVRKADAVRAAAERLPRDRLCDRYARDC